MISQTTVKRIPYAISPQLLLQLPTTTLLKCELEIFWFVHLDLAESFVFGSQILIGQKQRIASFPDHFKAKLKWTEYNSCSPTYDILIFPHPIVGWEKVLGLMLITMISVSGRLRNWIIPPLGYVRPVNLM